MLCLTGTISGNTCVGGLIGDIGRIYNTEEETVSSFVSDSLMLGQKIEKTEHKSGVSNVRSGTIGRICGLVGSGAGADQIYARADLTGPHGNSFSSDYNYNGESIPMQQLAQASEFERILGSESAPWNENWRLAGSGCYPQLLWEEGEPAMLPQ